ncbi:DUF6461 domain-containing protein [Streptosporangium sp. CA-115845]|uniref:DUF6461 domain-containing protein n=1 Tax=Streptosporangium sp. CA-115845 TaxID=3240071 RepID=UPI003D8F4BCB
MPAQIPPVGGRHSASHGGPAFCLAERLTGVTLTLESLEESTYLCGATPEPR